MNDEWGTPVSKEKIIARRNRLIEYQKTNQVRFTALYQIIDENILDINYMIYEIERLNNIINELEKWLESESNFWKEQQEKAIKNGWLEFGGKYNTTVIYENAINKLQELKGSVKNEL